jgi:transposase
MIAAWCHRQVVALLTFTVYCNTALVESWVQQCLVGQLKPRQVVVMDNTNTSFHKSTLVRQLIEQVGCTLLFLPPYSPDLNKIEKFWARLKHYLRKTGKQFQNLWDAVDNTFRQLS